MAVIRWQPWQEMETLHRQLDRLFDEMLPAPSGNTWANALRSGWVPAIELQSTDREVVLRAELPGMDAKDLDIQVTREAVALSGEYKANHKTEAGHRVRTEFRYGSFHRVIPMPYAVQNDQVKAEFKDGILTLTLPRLTADRPQVVKLNLTEAVPAPAAEVNAHTEAAPAVEANGNGHTSTEQPETGDVWAEPAHN